MLSNASPLFEKERYTLQPALASNANYPVLSHRPSMWAALAADNHPIDTGQIERAEIFKQRLNGEEPHDSGCVAKRGQPRQAMFAVFEADAEPDVRHAPHPVQLRLQEPPHAVVTLCQHLVDVPIGPPHDLAHRGDVGGRHVFVKQVAHRVDEDLSRSTPRERLI